MRISGQITDRKTGEPLAFATVVDSDSKGNQLSMSSTSGRNAVADIDGRYIVDAGSHITVSHVGYGKDTIPVSAMSCSSMGCTHNHKMKAGLGLPEVIITPTWWQKNWKKVALWGAIGTGIAVIGYLSYKKFGK